MKKLRKLIVSLSLIICICLTTVLVNVKPSEALSLSWGGQDGKNNNTDWHATESWTRGSQSSAFICTNIKTVTVNISTYCGLDDVGGSGGCTGLGLQCKNLSGTVLKSTTSSAHSGNITLDITDCSGLVVLYAYASFTGYRIYPSMSASLSSITKIDPNKPDEVIPAGNLSVGFGGCDGKGSNSDWHACESWTRGCTSGSFDVTPYATISVRISTSVGLDSVGGDGSCTGVGLQIRNSGGSVLRSTTGSGSSGTLTLDVSSLTGTCYLYGYGSFWGYRIYPSTSCSLAGSTLAVPTITASLAATTTNITVLNSATCTVSAANTTGYEWYINGKLYKTTTSGSIVVNGESFGNISGTHSLEVKCVSNIGSCNSNKLTFSVDMKPSVGTLSTNKTTLNASNTSATLSTSGTGQSSFVWYINNAYYTETTAASLSIGYSTHTNGTYKVKCYAKNAYGQSSFSNEVTITMNFDPRMDSISSNKTALTISDQNATLTCKATDATNYDWYVNGTKWKNTTTNTVTFGKSTHNANGTYKLKCIAKNAYGSSSASNEVTITADYKPVIESLSSDKVTLNNKNHEATLTCTSVGGTSYDWYVNGTKKSNTNGTFKVGLPNDGNGTYKVKAKAINEFGTSASFSNEITITADYKPMINTDLAASKTVLGLETETTKLTVVTANTLPETYKWYLGSTLLATNNSNSYDVPNSLFNNTNGDYTFRCNISNDYGNVTSRDVVISVNYPPRITSELSPDFNQFELYPDKVTYSVTSTNTDSYEWELNGENFETTSTPQIVVNKDTIEEKNGTYNLVCKAVNSYAKTPTRTVSLKAAYQPRIDANLTIDKDKWANYTDTSVLQIDALNTDKYEWFINDELFKTTTGDEDHITIDRNTIHSLNGTYRFFVRVHNEYGYNDSQTVTLTVEYPPEIYVNLGADKVELHEDSELATLNLTTYNTDVYEWYMNDNKIKETAEGTLQLDMNTFSNKNGTYVFKVKCLNDFGEDNSETVTINVKYPTRVWEEVKASKTIINDKTHQVELEINASNVDRYEWYNGDTLIGETTEGKFTLLEEVFENLNGTYTIKVKCINEYGVTESEIQIHVQYKPFILEELTCSNDYINIEAPLSDLALKARNTDYYEWVVMPGGLSFTTKDDHTVFDRWKLYDENGVYQVRVICHNKYGTATSKSVTIKEYFQKITVGGGSSGLGYMTGYTDDTFRPQNNMTRAEAATVIARLSGTYSGLADYTKKTKRYKDTSEDHWAANYMGFVIDKGLMIGYKDEFRPDDNITRGEFAKILYKMNEGKLQGTTITKKFPDVNGRYFRDYANVLLSRNMIEGLVDGTFSGDKEITRAEVVTMINGTLNKNVSKEMVKRIENSPAYRKFSDVADWRWYYGDVTVATSDYFEK